MDTQKKLYLQDDRNLVLSNDNNKTIWETKASGACPKGLEQFILFQLFYELSEITCQFPSKGKATVMTLKSSNYLFLWLAAIESNAAQYLLGLCNIVRT